MREEESFRLSSYIHKSCGFKAEANFEETENEHSYSHSPSWRTDNVFVKPSRTLFVHPSPESSTTKAEDDVDVETVCEPLPSVYDKSRAVSVMEEVDRHVNFQHPDEGNPDWEDHIPKINWSNMQSRLFNKVARVLHNDRLARLAHASHHNEPVLRRVTVDKTARRLRQILASVAWNVKYTQWLHTILMDNLHATYLVSYLDAMQTLKSKVPTLVDRMLSATSSRSALSTPNHELLNIIHKRPWDPLTGGIPKHKPRKLPQDPILVMVPSGPSSGTFSSSRTHHWMANLSTLGTVVCVYSNPGRVMGKVSLLNCLDHMFACTRAKVQEIHADYGDKPVVLVGIGSGAILACQVAMVENVSAVVCLGFPLYTVEGNRGTPDDNLLNLQVPVLFVIGQNGSTCGVDDLEEMREKINVVTSLVVVGSADDQLRLTKAKKKLDGITQTLVDKCIMDEVSDFLGTLLSPDYVPPVKPIIVHQPIEPPKRTVIKTIERKRKIDILPPVNPDGTPTLPVKKGRKPKMSMMQKIVQNKWAGQLPKSSGEVPRSVASTSAAGQSVRKHIVVDKKNVHFRIQNSKVTQSPTVTMTMLPPKPQPVSESTITVVAASSPSLSVTPVKGRLASGQLTSLSSILQPGTRGVLSPASCSVTSVDNLMSVKGLSSLSATASVSNMMDEFNILDMPVILDEENPNDTLPPVSMPVSSSVSPVKLILTNSKPGQAVKYVSSPGGQPVKIIISKADPHSKTVYLEQVGAGRGKAPRIRHIPAVKNKQPLYRIE